MPAPVALQKAGCILDGLHYRGSRAETPPIEYNGIIMERVVCDGATWFRDPEDHFCCSLEMIAVEARSCFANGKVSAAFRMECLDACLLFLIFLEYL